ncbi:hypothetical protein MMC11_004318 [Xylographa trunciseda]|nr:hypothetical protein [Xylographa trunciseda]
MVAHLTIFIKKLDSLSNEDFHTYWSTSHPKIWLNVKIVQEKVLKYSQVLSPKQLHLRELFHVDHDTSAALKAHGLPIVEYDGGVDIWAATTEDLMSIFQDEEYNRVVVPDEESFLKRSEAVMMIGHDEDKWVDGKVFEV